MLPEFEPGAPDVAGHKRQQLDIAGQVSQHTLSRAVVEPAFARDL